MNCVACATPNPPGAARCNKCHAPLPPTCAVCGVPVPPGTEICQACRTEPIDVKPKPSAAAARLLEATQKSGPEYELDSRFIGRRELLEDLCRRFVQCRDQRSLGYVALTSQAGFGKTRLARELGRAARAAVPEARVLYGLCGGPAAPPYAGFQRLLAARFGIADGEAPELAREKVLAGVTEALPAARMTEVSHLLANLCGCPFPDSPVVLPLAEVPAQLELRTFVAVRRFLVADAQRCPLLLIFDELERASPETINLINYLAAGLGEAPVMLLCLGRPMMFELHSRFGQGDRPPDRLELGPLAPEETQALLAELLKGIGEMPDQLAVHARERLDGSPRAAHELSRFLVEAGVIQPTTSGWRLDRALMRATKLPARPEELPQARLKIMDETERMLLEKASIMGEAFWLDGVVALVRAATAGRDPDGPSLSEIAQAGEKTRVAAAQVFSRLARRGWLAESASTGIPGECEYHFAYPPLWELVYDTIPEATRRADHLIIGQWLSLTPEGGSDKREEEVARHLERAGDEYSAARRYHIAADAARAQYHNDRAINLYTLALRCLGATHVAARINAWHDLGSVYSLKGDYEQALNAFERMLRLSWVVSSRAKAAVAFNKMGRVWRDKGDLKVALEYLERGLELFQQAGDKRGIAGSLDDIGQVLWLLDRYDQALERSRAALERRRTLGDRRSIARSLVNLGNIQKDRGLFDEAEACYREALDHQRQIGDRHGEGTTLAALGAIHYDRGDAAAAQKTWEEGLKIAEEIGAVPTQVQVRIELGELLRGAGRFPEARKHLEEAIALAQEIDEKRQQSEALRNLGLLALAQSRADEAVHLCRRALDLVEPAGFRQEAGRALLALAEVRAHATKPRGAALASVVNDTGTGAPADTYYARAVQLFRELGNEGELAKSLERFGRHRIDRDDPDGARGLLVEAQALYEKIGSANARQIKSLIDGLGAPAAPATPPPQPQT
jgi:tetratricopeptide (TPR) repeat protein